MKTRNCSVQQPCSATWRINLAPRTIEESGSESNVDGTQARNSCNHVSCCIHSALFHTAIIDYHFLAQTKTVGLAWFYAIMVQYDAASQSLEWKRDFDSQFA
jgi:hypothetical protein